MVIFVPLISCVKDGKERNLCEALQFIPDGHDVSINLTEDSGSS